MNNPLASSNGKGTFRILSSKNQNEDAKRILDKKDQYQFISNNKCKFPTSIKVLNLPEREDRWENFSLINKELFQNFNVERFESKSGQDVVLEIFNSFVSCLEESFKYHETIIVMEDDAYVVPGGIQKLEKAFLDLPSDWDILIGNHYFFGQMEILSNNLSKPSGNASSLNFAVYRNTVLDKIKNNLHLRNEDRFDFDHFVTSKQVPINNYTVWPMISREYVSFSDHKKCVKNMEFRIREHKYLFPFVDSETYYSSLEGW